MVWSMGVGGNANKGVGIAAGVAGIWVLNWRNEKADLAGYVVDIAARCLEVY
jgi:hypothetical protein